MRSQNRTNGSKTNIGGFKMSKSLVSILLVLFLSVLGSQTEGSEPIDFEDLTPGDMILDHYNGLYIDGKLKVNGSGRIEGTNSITYPGDGLGTSYIIFDTPVSAVRLKFLETNFHHVRPEIKAYEITEFGDIVVSSWINRSPVGQVVDVHLIDTEIDYIEIKAYCGRWFIDLLDFDPCGFVYGRVTDSDTGEPFDGAWVFVTPANDPNTMVRSTRTDLNGEYGLMLPAGQWCVTCWLIETSWWFFRTVEISVDSLEVLELNFEFDYWEY